MNVAAQEGWLLVRGTGPGRGGGALRYGLANMWGATLGGGGIGRDSPPPGDRPLK